ncbi:autotransporter domain-containing protein [Ochrobactrum sp. MR28]|nr:autotransporter domain-containing protein [Ochrobactrum sp. MR28]MBX8818435.1 autotransporter domain-containing protein [Ochrobactrum sp. MR31]
MGEDSSGTISISNTGSVTVTGEGSGALVARSVVMRDDAPDAAPLMNMLSADMLPFDTPDFMMFTGNGAAGNVSINQTGNLIATGAGSSAIFAQSTGATNGNIDIVVQAESLLVGHSAGVTLIDGAENSLANHGIITGIGNTVGYIPGTDGQLLAAGWIDGMAVVGTTGNTAVTNTGLMVGNIDLGSGRNTFTNAQDAWLVSGSLIGLGGQTGSDFINDGILTPGGSTMTQTTQIDGNLNQTANGRYLVGLDFAGSTSANDPVMARMAAAQQSPSASGSADRLNVSGSANLGGSMALSVANSGYAKSGRNDYVALRAEGGVNDDGMLLVAPNTAVATYTLEYTDKETILGANIDYAARGLTENGISVGTTINAIQTDQTSSAFRPLAEAIFAQPDIASLQRTYDLIDGEGTAGVQQAYFSETNAFIGAVSQQSNRWSNPYRQVGATVGQERDCIVNSNSCEESRWRGWYSGFGSDVSIDGDPYVVGSGDLSSQSKGMAAGFDYEINQNLLLGLAVGIGQTDFKVPDRLTQGDIRTGRTALYGAYKQNNFYVDGLVGVDWFDASTSRVAQIAATGSTAAFSDRLQNDFSGYGINARLETGYRTDLGGVQITPFAALQLSSFRMNGSTERADATSGDLALYYKDRTINSVPLSLGAQLDTQLELGKNAYFAPYIRAAWVHEFSNKRSVEAGFTAAPGYEFVVHGAAQARNSAQLEAGFDMQIETGLSLYGKVTGNFSGSAHDVSGSGGFRLRW